MRRGTICALVHWSFEPARLKNALCSVSAEVNLSLLQHCHERTGTLTFGRGAASRVGPCDEYSYSCARSRHRQRPFSRHVSEQHSSPELQSDPRGKHVPTAASSQSASIARSAIGWIPLLHRMFAQCLSQFLHDNGTLREQMPSSRYEVGPACGSRGFGTPDVQTNSALVDGLSP